VRGPGGAVLAADPVTVPVGAASTVDPVDPGTPLSLSLHASLSHHKSPSSLCLAHGGEGRSGDRGPRSGDASTYSHDNEIR
jgi:hypothetical protein